MSKSIAEIARHPARFGALALLAIAVALLALLIARLDTEAVHNEALLEVDGNEEFDGGTGFDPGTDNCNPFSVNAADPDPDDCINTAASFDWADDPDADGNQGLCARDTDGYITEASSLPSVPSGASIDDLICQADFYQGSTQDTSYHTGSDKDYQDTSGPEPVWHCVDLSNATSKADLLNAMFAVMTTASGDQVVYFGAERDVEHGSVFNGYWILQDDVGVDISANDPNNGVGDGGQLDCSVDDPRNFTGVHICGDVLLLFNYESGGRVGKVGAFQWVPDDSIAGLPAGDIGCDRDGDALADATCTAAEQADGDSVGLDPGPGFLCVKFEAGSGDCRATVSFGDDLCGRVNGATDCTIAPKKTAPEPPPCSGPGAFAAPWEPDDGDPASELVQPPTFSEVGVNLTDLGLELPCIAALIAESRSSPSTTATLKDFVSAPTGAECVSEIRTEIHDVANHGDTDEDIQGDTVYRGTVIHDAAFVLPTGAGGNATGTVTFVLFSNGTCDPGEADANVISTETVTITDQIPAGIPSGTEGQIDSSNFDTDDTTATAISYTASADLDEPYGDSSLADEDCETLSIISPSTTLDKELAFSVEVTYSYSEANDGDDPLTNPSVSDPVCVANGGTVIDVDVSPADGFNDGDTSLDGVLDPGETFLFECTVTLTEADLDSFPVTNTAVGHGTDSLGRDVTVCTAGAGTPTPAPGPNNGQFCDPDETDSTSIDITVDQGK